MSHNSSSAIRFIVILFLTFMGPTTAHAARLTVLVVDADSRQALPVRVYLRTSDGTWLFVKTAAEEGEALPYNEQWVPMVNSVERHTTVSAHPFQADLEPGTYGLTIERGKEYVPYHQDIRIAGQDIELTIRLERWSDMADRGWFSGETHVHRRIHELPNVMLAEDLNITFPVTFWTTKSTEPPSVTPSSLRRQGPSPFGNREDRGTEPIEVDPTHWIVPRNTEYEIFSVGKKRHVLGAVFILNHKSIFKETMPPVGAIAERAHSEGALLDLDKHSWPWAMMLVPVAKVDLFELSNNSVWRTEFGFRTSSVKPAEYMKVEMKDGGMTERGWLNFGFQNYYALLNCGFRLQPTAGTASGVHPVPLGHSRVYVHLDDAMNVDSWVRHLRAGQCFVTTGPMLDLRMNDRVSGAEFVVDHQSRFRISGECRNLHPLDRVEIIVNGKVAQTLRSENVAHENRCYITMLDINLVISKSSWVCVRVIEERDHGRMRFAHTAPWYVRVGDDMIQPRHEEIQYLIKRVETEIERNRGVISPEALGEFEKALQEYQAIARRAR